MFHNLEGKCHRDIKPDNITFSEPLEPQFIDFGFSSSAGIRHFIKELGTPGYRWDNDGNEISAESENLDIFALGVTLFANMFSMHPLLSPQFQNSKTKES
jgi:serine/threonine protein kinase